MRWIRRLALLWVSAGCAGVIGIGPGESPPEELALRQEALVIWEFGKNGATGELKDASEILYSNPNGWNRLVVGLMPADGGATPTLSAVAIDSAGGKVLVSEGSSAPELPLKITRKPLAGSSGSSWDFRVLDQHNLVVYRKFFAHGQEVSRPATQPTPAQTDPTTPTTGPIATPAAPASADPRALSAREQAVGWTFDTLGSLMWKDRIWLSKPDQPVQRAAIARLLGTDVCPDETLSATELGSNQFPSVRGRDFANQALVNKNNRWNVNLSLFFNQLRDRAIAQPFTGEQRAAVLCTLSFFAIEHMRRTHNGMDFIKPWNQEFTRALQEAELAFYGSIQKSVAPGSTQPIGSPAQPAGAPPMGMQECVSNGGGPTPNNIAPTQTPQTTPIRPEELPPQPQTPTGAGSSGTPPCQEAPPVSSPLVIPTDDRGLLLTGLGDGVRFDLLGNGQAVTTGWVRRGALLALDLDQSGAIESGAELFGEATRLADGTRAADGFAALSQYDQRAQGGRTDGRIDRADRVYPRLLLWQDQNQDGLSQAAELIPLAQAGIASISLSHGPSDFPAGRSFGNQVRLQASARLTSGQLRPVYDVWFAYAPTPDALLCALR